MFCVTGGQLGALCGHGHWARVGGSSRWVWLEVVVGAGRGLGGLCGHVGTEGVVGGFDWR